MLFLKIDVDCADEQQIKQKVNKLQEQSENRSRRNTEEKKRDLRADRQEETEKDKR